MNIMEVLLSRRRMILTASIIMSLLGVISWQIMPRQEDPEMRDYWGNIQVPFPGADAEKVERLLLEPIEERLAEVEEIQSYDGTAMQELALIHIELNYWVEDIDKAWDEVRHAMELATPDFPDGIPLPQLNDKLNDQDSIVLAITGSINPLELLKVAREVRLDLLSINEVIGVHLVADPGEQITIEFDETQARKLGIDAAALAQQLGVRNTTQPGGSVKLAGRKVNIQPQTEFRSIEEIENQPILLASGSSIPLREIASIRLGPVEPSRSYMRHNGAMAVGLGIVPKPGVHLVNFGKTVLQHLEVLRERYAPLNIEVVEYQPGRVESRLADLSQSLAIGIGIVALILLVAMGFRLGLVVAVVIPLVAFASLAVYAAGGGTLHQISIAALVIALGMLVDNAIVVIENIQYRIDRGSKPHQAAMDAVRELALPLGSATGTTLAAFIPMLIAEGTTGEFTRAIPIIIMLTLAVSYVFAILVSPALAEIFLKPNTKSVGGVMDRISSGLANFSTRQAPLVLLAALVVVGLSFSSAGMLRQQFFPASDRNQLIVDFRMPEGTHIDETDQAVRFLERALSEESAISQTASFVGRSTPHFYYNLPSIPFMPHFGQLVVNTHTIDDVDPLIARIRKLVHDQLPEGQIIPRKLEQGPPVTTPIEVRLYGSELSVLNAAADRVMTELRDIPGTVDVRHDLSLGAPSLNFEIDDAVAARFGISRSDVARTIYGRTRGLPVGEYRAGDDPIPVVLRSQEGETLDVSDLATIMIETPSGTRLPVDQVAELSVDFRPGAIEHRNGRRVVTVSSELLEGVAFSEVQAALEVRMAQLDLGTVRWEFGGQAEGSSEANTSMILALPWGLVLLIAILLAEFNSFRRVAIIMVTVPLSAAGVIPGLILGDQPFGFMSFLGVIALVGVVVNNAIVLLDVIEKQRGEGATLETAIREAVMQRTRPILLTTGTTVAGLAPLAFSNTTLWPPLAWAMISGLLASTLLTLLVVPALYLMLFGGPSMFGFKPKATIGVVPAAAMLLLSFVLVGLPAQAQEITAANRPTITLRQTLQRALTRPAMEAAKQRVVAAESSAVATKRSAIMPDLVSNGAIDYSNDLPEITTPDGTLELGEKTTYSVDASVIQPIFKPATLLYEGPAAERDADAAKQAASTTGLQLAGEAAQAFLDMVSLEAQQKATEAFIRSLKERENEIEARVEVGRALRADRLKVTLDLERAMLDLQRLNNAYDVAAYRLGRTVGMSGAVYPEYDLDEPVPAAPSTEEAIERAIQNRPDLAELKLNMEAFELRYKAVGAEALPEARARGTWTWNDGDAFNDGSRFFAALEVSWNPFNSGTRKHRKAALEAQRKGVAAQLEDAARQVRLDIRQAMADLNTSLSAVAVAKRGVEFAGETLRVERERHANGRATTNDLLDAEAQLRDETTNLDLAKLDVVRAYINLKLSMGELKE